MATYFVTRTMPIDDIDDKSHKTELKSSKNYSTNHIKKCTANEDQGKVVLANNTAAKSIIHAVYH